MIDATPDAYIGLDNASPEAWAAWHAALEDERRAVLARAGLEGDYRDPSTDWSDATFRQLFLFMYDASFYDGSYRVADLVRRWRSMFGRIDSVLLWHAYPRLGFDTRTQFDFYHDMPGGLDRLRGDVVDVLHGAGIRVFVDYNPWDEGSYDELGDIVAALDADGVMLDTLTDAPERLERAVLGRKRGVVFAPELRPRTEDLGRLRQSWAQWSEIGDEKAPTILKNRWLVPRHRQLAIRRWDASRRIDIGYSFFNGSGLLLWDNVFGVHNPYSPDDRRLIAETAAVLDRYEDLFTYGEWAPLVPTGVSGLDANRWTKGGRSILTLRNRTNETVRFCVPDGPDGTPFWGEHDVAASGRLVSVEAKGVQAIVFGDAPEASRAARSHFAQLSAAAVTPRPGYDERAPHPRLGSGPIRTTAARSSAALAAIPGSAGEVTLGIRHERRECGCYPIGASDEVMWGWFYKDPIAHAVRTAVAPFAMRITAVTNAEFLAFVHGAAYVPADQQRFLSHLPRDASGALPERLPDAVAALPVTYVSLADARAFAAWHGERLPTEAEWQWAAEGAGAEAIHPWGAEARSAAGCLQSAADSTTATPQGVMGLSGNAWELTESEFFDGHTRFVMLRGGSYLAPRAKESEWLVARGPRPNDFHAKYLLLADGLDRSEAISFRTVR